MDIAKLDLNWGGVGFPAYEGRMEDTPASGGAGGESGPMDSQERVEAALAAFHGNEGADSGKESGQSGQQPVAGGQAQGDGGQIDPAQQVQGGESQLTDEQRNADPVFKELNQFKSDIGAVFDKHGLGAAAESNGRTAAQEADLQLADANILYQIMRGERTPSNLLDTMVTVGNWQKSQKDAVAGDLIAWLTKAGYLKDGQAPGASKPNGQDKGGFKDPVDERLSALEKQNREASERAQNERVTAERNRVGKVFIDEVNRLCKADGVPDRDHIFYAEQVGAIIAGNKAMIDRIGKGNFVDLKKAFDTVKANELARIQRYNEAQLRKQAQKDKNPKSPAGGSPAAAAGSAKRNFANRDERIAAASAAFQE